MFSLLSPLRNSPAKVFWWAGILSGVALLAMTASAAPAPVTLASLIEEMTSYEAIARWPSPEYSVLQASSYDRRSVARDQDGWFANDDFSGRVREETNAGRREEVLLDEAGPGCLVRFWLTTDSNKRGDGTLRIYLDGNREPALSFPAYDLLSGERKIPAPFATAHPGYAPDGFGGNTLMLPIPYARHCKVTWEERGRGKRYFQINFRRYAAGTPVQTLTPEILDAAAPLLPQAAKRLQHPPTPPAGEKPTPFALGAKASKSFELPPGPRAAHFLSFRLTTPDGAAREQALRSLVVKMTFDGAATVWCPASDFFASGVGVNPVENFYNTVTADGTMISRWVMPYRRAGRITLENLGSVPVAGTLEWGTRPWAWDERSMHFHTAWKFQAGLRTPPIADWNFVSIEGRGVYAGDTLALFNEAATWYGEGDEKIFVDGGDFPSHFGTGTEDYYNYSFAPRREMQTPFANLVRVDQEATQGHNVMSRSRNLDVVPFRKSFSFDLELISWKPTRLLYAATSRWYAFPGATSNVAPDPASAVSAVPTLAEAMAPAPAFPGVVDAEELAVTDASPGLVHEKQDMQEFGLDGWSRGEQRLGRGTKVGDFLTISVPAPGPAPGEVRVALTGAPDFGRLAFTVNGEPSPARFDGYASQVVHRGEISLGTFAPVEGKFSVRIEVTGANPASSGPRHYFGIDYFRIRSGAGRL